MNTAMASPSSPAMAMQPAISPRASISAWWASMFDPGSAGLPLLRRWLEGFLLRRPEPARHGFHPLLDAHQDGDEPLARLHQGRCTVRYADDEVMPADCLLCILAALVLLRVPGGHQGRHTIRHADDEVIQTVSPVTRCDGRNFLANNPVQVHIASALAEWSAHEGIARYLHERICSQWSGPSLKPTLSTSSDACLRYLAISVSERSSGLMGPKDFTMLKARHPA